MSKPDWPYSPQSPYSPYSPSGSSTAAGFYSPGLVPPLHLHQPPSAPRMGSVPLPSTADRGSSNRTFRPPPAPALPIDLRYDLEHDRLAVIPNLLIPSSSIVHVLRTDLQGTLLQIPTGDRRTTAHHVIRDLSSQIRAPLSLDTFRALHPATQRAVRACYFARQSGNGSAISGLWHAFQSGEEYAQGPKGEDLVLGHVHLWYCGKEQGGAGRWVISVDVPSRS
ncbi:hypothetical protein C8F01DRAFT_35990 [Mycena amicta]|nr:hypothetical protein C8F01DRAFT_35990 [Mycena amicta]